MRLILVTLPVHRLEAVRESLSRRRIERLTIADAHGLLPGHADIAVSRLVVLEIAVNDDFLEPALSAVVEAIDGPAADRAERAADDVAGRRIQPGRQDGVRVDVLPIHETIQLYRSVRGAEAI